MKVIDIFSDASVLGKVDRARGNRVCAGAISVINDRRDKEYHCVIEGNTNNYGELTGLYLAIKLAAEYKDEYTEFNVYSDSNISVMGLKEWIYNWITHMDENGTMYTGAGGVVANQTIIKSIIDFIINTFDPEVHRINILHCKGHVNINSVFSLNNAYTCLARNFRLAPDHLVDLIPYIQKWNNYIDESTRASLTRMQHGVIYKPDEGKCTPALFDERLIYPIYFKIVRNKL